MATKRIDMQVGMFPFELTCFIGPKKKDLIKQLEDEFDCTGTVPYDGSQGRAAFIQTWGNHFIVALPAYRNTPQWISVAGHEMCHVCVELFKLVRIEIGNDSGEAFCYLHQYLMNELLTSIKNK